MTLTVDVIICVEMFGARSDVQNWPGVFVIVTVETTGAGGVR